MSFVMRKRGLSLLLVLCMIFSLMSGMTTVRADEITPTLTSTDKIASAFASPQTGTPYNASGNYDVTVPHVIINQIYGGQKIGGSLDKTVPVSNSFVELYNPTDSDINLQGWTLNYAINGEASTNGTQNGPWYTLPLTGTIKAHTSYLVRMMATQTTKQYLRLDIVSKSNIVATGSAIVATGSAIVADQDWNQFVANKGGVFVLLSTNDTLPENTNPFIANAGKPNDHYVDMIGVGGNDAGTNDKIFAYEGNFTGSQSKQKAIRRVGFQDTDYNATVDNALPEWGNNCDTQVIGYNALSPEQIAWARPRSQADGVWANYLGGTNAQAPMPAPPVTTTLDSTAPNCLTNSIGNDSKTSHLITWQMPSTVTAGKVKYSTVADLSGATEVSAVVTNNGNNTVTMRVALNGLTPGTKYYYSVAGNGADYDSNVYTFKTDDGASAFSFVHVSDTQGINESQYKDYWGPAVSKIMNQYPDASFLIETGDLVDTMNNEDQWRWFFNSAKNIFGNYSFIPVIGNHEQTAKYDADAFRQHFTVPNALEDPNVTPGTVYSFDYSNTHFVVLNSECKTTAGITAMQNWLKDDLSHNTKTWTIAAFHMGPFGTGNNHADTYDSFTTILMKYSVDLILHGHDHVYMRTSDTDDDHHHIIALESGGSGFKQDSTIASGQYTDVSAIVNNPSYSIINISSDKISVNSVYVDMNNVKDQSIHPILDDKGNSVNFEIKKVIPVTPNALTLTPGSDTSKLRFTWYSNDDATNNASVVKIGPASTFPTGATIFTGTIGAASAGNQWHKVNVDNLTPGTVYAYSISNDSTNFSKNYTYTAPATGDFSFASVGDPQLTTGQQDSNSNYHKVNGNIGTTKEGWQDTVTAIAKTNISFIASVGDIADSTVLNEAQYSNFFSPSELANIPFSPAVGNHDINAGFTYHFNMPNLQSFANPVASDKYLSNKRNAEIAQAEATGNYWYTYNNALFVVLNDSAYPTSKTQAATYIQRFELTLSKAIAANPNYKWLFVQHHKSTQSVADHCADYDIEYYVEAGFEKLMDTYKVDFVLAGHDHVYARSYPMKDGKIDPNNKGNDIVNPNGTVYLTLTTSSGLKYYTPFAPGVNNVNYPYLADGTAGKANISATNKPIGTNVYLQANTPEFTKVDVTDNKVTFNTYNIDNVNKPIDSFTVTKATPKTITIFHTNDLHGSMVSSSSTIGLDKIAAYKSSVPGSLLVDGGDATQGSSFATLTKGADVMTLMNMAGYDVMAAGNHEFDYGLDQLLINAKKANFPILSANAVKNGDPVLKGTTYANGTRTNNGSWYIKEVDGVRVGFFGITTPETATKTNPEGIKGVTFGTDVTGIAAMALSQINTLKAQGATVIVGLMHLGVDPSSTVTSEAIADSLGGSGLNLIIDGHSHSVVDELRANGIYIAQSGNGAKYLGKLEITLNQNSVSKIEGTTITPATATITPVATITAKANDILNQQKTLLTPIVGKTSTTLWGGTINGINEARVYETNLGSLIADSMVADTRTNLIGSQYASLPVVALQNGGGVRAVIKAGDITKGDILNVLPFGNSIAYKLVTPKVLYQALENSIGKITAQDVKTGKITGADGRFPQISGMRFEFDPTQTATTYDGSNNPITYGNRVTKVVLLKADGTDGVVLGKNDTTTKIVLASNDFEIAGGDGYIMLKGLTSVGEGGVLDQIIADYVGKLTKSGGGSFAYPITTGRIKTVGAGYTPIAYTANITIKNMTGAAISNTTVSYKVDGAVKTGTTNANGILSIAALSDGPHTISFVGVDDVMVNNYSGAGVTNSVTVSTTLENIAANTVIYNNNGVTPASIKAKEYTITFGNGIANATTVGNKLISLPTPTLEGYTFDGWYLDNTTFTTPITIATVFTANTTVYAKWTAITVGTPASVKAKVASYNSVKLTWSSVSGATGYVIYRSTSSAGTYTEVATLTTATETYTDVSLNTGSTYYYKVKAVKSVGTLKAYSIYSAVASAKPVLSKPTAFKVGKDNPSSAKVTFVKVSGASKYEIYIATSLRGTYTLASSTALTSYTMTRLTSGKVYYVKVRAYTLVGKTKVYSRFTSIRRVKI